MVSFYGVRSSEKAGEVRMTCRVGRIQALPVPRSRLLASFSFRHPGPFRGILVSAWRLFNHSKDPPTEPVRARSGSGPCGRHDGRPSLGGELHAFRIGAGFFVGDALEGRFPATMFVGGRRAGENPLHRENRVGAKRAGNGPRSRLPRLAHRLERFGFGEAMGVVDREGNTSQREIELQGQGRLRVARPVPDHHLRGRYVVPRLVIDDAAGDLDHLLRVHAVDDDAASRREERNEPGRPGTGGRGVLLLRLLVPPWRGGCLRSLARPGWWCGPGRRLPERRRRWGWGAVARWCLRETRLHNEWAREEPAPGVGVGVGPRDDQVLGGAGHRDVEELALGLEVRALFTAGVREDAFV